MPLLDTMVLRLAQRIDPRNKAAQQTFNDSLAAIAITGAADNGAGLIRITAAGHGLQTSRECYITGVGGTLAANNTLANLAWVATYVSASQVDLVGSAFAGAYTSGGTLTPARIGSSRGDALEPQQILDIYNQGRMAAFAALRRKVGRDLDTLQREVGSLITSATVTFTGSTPAVVTKPTGFIDFVSLNDATGVIPLVGADMLEAILEGRPNWVQSASNRHVYEQGTQLVHSSSFVTGACTLKYIGITDFTLTQLLSGTSSETFSDQHLDGILELAQYVSEEHGANEVAALANRLFGVA